MIQIMKFYGVFLLVLIIVNVQGELDKVGMVILLDYFIVSKVNGVLLLGSGGEFCYMINVLCLEIVEFCVCYINCCILVLLGISSISMQEVIEYGQYVD